MYTVALSKTLFQSGQEFLKAFSGTAELSKLPQGVTEHLSALSAQAQSCWQVYVTNSPWGVYVPDGNKHLIHESIFGNTVRAITLATLGAEIITQYFWVVRMEYYLNQISQMGDEHKAFAASAKAMMRLMFSIAKELNANPTPTNEAESHALTKRLHYALHITELALKICQPKGYGEQSWHPDTRQWMGMRVRTLRGLSRVSDHSARFLEAQQRELTSGGNL